MSGSDRPADPKSWASDLAFSLLGVGAGLVGVAIGASGPFGVCAVAFGFICGLTESGLLLVLAIVSTALSGVLGLKFRQAWWVFVPSLMLAVGLIAGHSVIRPLIAG